MRTTFELISVKGTKRYRINGKRRQETRVFEQTINPWNADGSGRPKHREQILAELRAERDAWLAEKVADHAE
jgi:hypothetical protein